MHMTMLRIAVAAAAASLLAACTTDGPSEPPRVQAGTLSCSVAPGTAFIFGSTREINCFYTRADGQTERYVGEIQRWGVDVGYTNAATVIWAVVAGTRDLAPGALAGDYGGVSAAVTPGIGGAANVLVGGSNRSIALQPVSVEGNTGLNLAAGIGSIRLRRP
jgi:hypothetical protein